MADEYSHEPHPHCSHQPPYPPHREYYIVQMSQVIRHIVIRSIIIQVHHRILKNPIMIGLLTMEVETILNIITNILHIQKNMSIH